MYWNKIDGDDGRLGFHEPGLSVRTISDLNSTVLAKLSSFQDIDCIVGVPRSGLLVASILALHLNVPLVHLHDFIAGNFEQSYTRRKGARHKALEERGSTISVLVVDDATGNGVTFSDLRRRFAEQGLDERYKLRYMGAYCTLSGAEHVDVYLDIVPFPRVFEWNLLHHTNSRYFCIDLDGVLCDDPTVDENDDGENYDKFCLNVKPKVIPTERLGAIVTARLERYRPQTEEWLRRYNISYDRLVMCNLTTGTERRRLQAHAILKADVYKTMGGLLFVESDLGQAKAIQAHTERPVFCFGHGLVNSNSVATPVAALVPLEDDTALKGAQLQIKQLSEEVHALRTSTSWRVSAPLRLLASPFRR